MAKHTPLNRKRIKEPSELEKEIGGRFKDIRSAHKETQEEMAEKLGKSVQTIHNYEKGITRLPYEIMIALNEIYHESIDELLLGNGKSMELMIERELSYYSDVRLNLYLQLISKEISKRLERNSELKNK